MMTNIKKNKNIHKRCSNKMKTLWQVVQIVRYLWVLVAKDKWNHPAADSLRGIHEKSWS